MTLELFTPPPPEPAAESTWTQIYLSRLDRTYRYRIHWDRIGQDTNYTEQAPGTWRFELEFHDPRDGTWREVRLHSRRDEIWALVRGRLNPPPRDEEMSHG